MKANKYIFLTVLIIIGCIKFSFGQYIKDYSKRVILISDTVNFKTLFYKGKFLKVFSTLVDSNYTELVFPDNLIDGNWVALFREDTSKIAAIVNYKKNKLNGAIKMYYFNGQLHDQYKYKNGKKNGVHYSFYRNGVKQSKVKFKNDEAIDKTFKTWDSEGKPFYNFYTKKKK